MRTPDSSARAVRCAIAPASALFTTNTSTSSSSPAFMNWSVSPLPGFATNTSVSTTSATAASDCPTPTVSTNTRSNAAARIATAAQVCSAMPPRRSRAAIERMNTPASPPLERIRIRSPSSAPPVRWLDGSTAITATVSPARRSPRTIPSSSVDLPAPGAPVMPIRALPGKGSSRSSASSSASASARGPGRWSSARLSAAATAARSRCARRTARSGRSARLRHDVDDLVHDAREVEVLRRVHARDPGRAQRVRILVGDDAADYDGQIAAARRAQALEHVDHEHAVRAREDREADYVYAFVASGARDLLRRQPDALVDHFDADVSRLHGNLFGAVAVAVQPGLAHE